MSIHDRSAIPDSVLVAGRCRVFLLALRKKTLSAVLPTWCLFSRGKEPFISGSQKPTWTSQRFRVWSRNCRTGEDTPWLHLRSSQLRKQPVIEPGQTKPVILSKNDGVWSTHEEALWRNSSESSIPLYSGRAGLGAAIWACVFNSEVMWGMCKGFHVSVYVVGCAAMKG